MLPSAQCLSLIKASEGCRLIAYQDDRGIWTIGWGHTGPEVHKGLVWSQSQADAAFLADVNSHAKGVQALAPSLTQGQLDALTSFAYNVGLHDLKGSTLLKLHNAGLYLEAAMEFPKWVHSGTHIDRGLVIRRAKEKLMYLGEPR